MMDVPHRHFYAFTKNAVMALMLLMFVCKWEIMRDFNKGTQCIATTCRCIPIKKNSLLSSLPSPQIIIADLTVDGILQ